MATLVQFKNIIISVKALFNCLFDGNKLTENSFRSVSTSSRASMCGTSTASQIDCTWLANTGSVGPKIAVAPVWSSEQASRNEAI